MPVITTIVDGDIPPNRMLKLYVTEDPAVFRLGFPDKQGTTVDYVTETALSDGQTLTFDHQKVGTWDVESNADLVRGDDVATDVDGRVILLPDAEVVVGTSLEPARPGQKVYVMKMSRSSTRIKYPPKQPVDNKTQSLEDKTVPELKAMAKAVGVTGYSSLTKPELIERLEGEK